MDVEQVEESGSCNDAIIGESLVVRSPPVKRRKRRKIHKVKKDTTAVPQGTNQAVVAVVEHQETEEEKQDADGFIEDVKEKGSETVAWGESSVSEIVTDEQGITGSGSCGCTNDEEMPCPSSASKTGNQIEAGATVVPPRIPEVSQSEKPEKQVETSSAEVTLTSTSSAVNLKRESSFKVTIEAKNYPVSSRYSRFDFLANSMIITDVTTERGTVTVKECSAYEGFYGPELDTAR